MIICICNGLSSEDIDQAIADGADSAREVYRALGVVPNCGNCRPHIEVKLRAARTPTNPATSR